MAARLELSEHETRVVLGGRFSVSNCRETQATLIEALALGRPLRLDLADLGEADVSLVQLVLCTRASARALGIVLTITHHGYAFRHTLERSGFADLLEEPWMDGEEVQYFLFDGVG